MPAMIPIIIPAMNPPPIMRLKIANGKIITSAITPLLRIMMTEARIIVNPMIMPSANAYVGPITGSQKNIDDHCA